MTPESERLIAEFTSGYEAFLHSIDPSLSAGAVAEATARLRSELGSLLELPANEQRRSPLEVVRMVTAEVVEVAEPRPAGSDELGEAARAAHIAWGIAKAEAVAGVVPGAGETDRRARVVLVSGDLMDRTRIADVLDGAGLAMVPARNPAAVADVLSAGRRPVAAFVDLTHGAADSAIRDLAAAGVRVVAYGPHVDDLAMVRAKALGASEAVPRSRFFRDPAAYLPRLT